MQVGAVALEERVRGDRQENIEIAGGSAAQARLAFAGKPDAGAVLDAARNIDRQRALAGDAAGAGAGGQGSSITWPRPWQVGQVRSSVKKPWAWRILPAPPQVAQTFGLVPALAPEPEQVSQITEVGMRICAVLPT